MKRILTILSIIILASCHNESYYFRQMNNAYKKYPNTFINECKSRIPNQPTIVKELVKDSIVHDTIKGDYVYVNCDSIVKTDTINKVFKVPCSDKLVNTHYITIRKDSSWEDTKKIALLRNKLDTKNAKLIKTQKELQYEKESKKKWRKVALIWLSILGLIAVYKLSKIFRLKIL